MYSDVEHNLQLFLHEFAHNMFTSAHNFGANGTDGDYLYINTGWSMMMDGGANTFYSVNAWEKWFLGWMNPIEVSTNSTVTLGDFITQNQAIKIPLPYSNGTKFIWLENRQKINTTFDGRLYWAGYPISSGIYLLQSDQNNDRSAPYGFNDQTNVTKCNYLKTTNRKGNRDFGYEATGVEIDGRDVAYYPIADNPISAQSSFGRLRFDYNGNNYIDVSRRHGNEGYSIASESDAIIAEKTAPGAPYSITWATVGNTGDAFVTGDKIGFSGIVPLLNIPRFDNYNQKLDPYYVNPLEINVLSYNSTTKEYSIQIKFDQYNLTASKRWTGYIILPNNMNPSGTDLTIDSNVTLTLDKSGTPNRQSKHSTTNDFVNPTMLEIEANASLKLLSNAKIIISNFSSLFMNSGSTVELEDGAMIIVKSGCNLIVKNGSYLTVKGSASIIVESGGNLCIENGANVNLQVLKSSVKLKQGHILNASTGLISIYGKTCSCIGSKAGLPKTGSGDYRTYDTDVYIQNTSFSSSQYFSGRNIYVGYDVTTPPYGAVYLNSGANIILDSEINTEMKNQVEINSGGSLEIINQWQ